MLYVNSDLRFSAIAIANILLVAKRVAALVGVLAKDEEDKYSPKILAIRPCS